MMDLEQRTSRTANSLRSHWVQVNCQDLMEMVDDDHRSGEDVWTLTPWQRRYDCREIMRSFLLHSQDGRVYAIYLRRTRKECL